MRKNIFKLMLLSLFAINNQAIYTASKDDSSILHMVTSGVTTFVAFSNEKLFEHALNQKCAAQIRKDFPMDPKDINYFTETLNALETYIVCKNLWPDYQAYQDQNLKKTLSNFVEDKIVKQEELAKRT